MRPLLCLALSLLLPATLLASPPGAELPRTGDEILVAGHLFHTGTRVILWFDAGGYDAYRPDTRLPPVPGQPPERPLTRPAYGTRSAPLTDAELARAKSNAWTLDDLRQHVDQFVLHYDVCGVSQSCFRVLHTRGLSVHFMCDLDGTLYQTIDLRDETWHATSSNGRSIGVEIANIGAYPPNVPATPLPILHVGSASADHPSPTYIPIPLAEWYALNPVTKEITITIPPRFGHPLHTPNFVPHPARNSLITGIVQGNTYRQFDFTPQQYNALEHLAATLCTVFPKIQPDYPRQRSTLGPPTTQATTQPAPNDPTTQPSAIADPDQPGALIPHALSWEQLDNFQGILGHYHVQLDKQDPGPAFQWQPFIEHVRTLMTPAAKLANLPMRHHPAKFVPSPPTPATTPTTHH